MTELSSRARMLAALGCATPDHVPCSFMLYGGLHGRCADYAGFVRAQVAMGLDAVVELPPRPPVVVNDYYNLHGLPVSYDPRVTVREWIERLPGEEWPVMVKEYGTPAGTLRAEVRQTDDWRWGDHVPFLDDYIVPRARRFIVNGPEDLPALRYLLMPPTVEEIAAFHTGSAPLLDLARQGDLLLSGGWGVGADLVGWVYGLERMIFAEHDQPAFLAELLDVIAAWNRARMELVLSAGIDLYIKRAWYENCDFWSPRSWRKFLLPVLAADVELAHARGAKFGYLITANCMPLLEMIAEAGVDAIIGVDPRAWDLAETKRRLGGKVSLWGGVNGHLTVEHGTAQEVRVETEAAIGTLGPDGFILSPVDNVREHTGLARANVAALIAAWQTARGPRGD
jgi:hypothetical protein